MRYKRPQNLQQALALDRESGNTMCQHAVDLKMNTILPAFDLAKNNKDIVNRLDILSST